jgi:DUF1365 family protein
MKLSPFSSYNRWNWTGYDERDHFGHPQKTLRQRLTEDAANHGITLPDGKIFLLTHLRYLGYVFNPVSFFYCYDKMETLAMILGEVNSTFGESHNYWLTQSGELPNVAAKRYQTAKRMHVSPFQPMNLEYDWILTPPGETLVAHMNTLCEGRPNFDATLQLDRRPWTSAQLVKVLTGYPLMTLRVIAGIHWQALQLWLKKVPVYTHTAKLDRPEPTGVTKGHLIG